MMNNLFSTFDPNSSFSVTPNWISSIILIFLIPNLFWISKNQIMMIFKKIIFSLHMEFKMNFGKLNSPGHTHWAIGIFTLIILNNLFGLTPYTFTSSSHLSFTLFLGLTFWLSYLVFSLIKDSTHSLAHLVPMGTPSFLLPIMVMIESISSLIRPITLSVRLTANMVAGHLLISLASGPMSKTSYVLMIFLLAPLSILMILESAVAWIQAYVFSMLSTLYLSEVNFKSVNKL